MAHCPADDNDPSLSMSERNGKFLVHCFDGCDQQDVFDALRARGLVAPALLEKPTLEASYQWHRDCERSADRVVVGPTGVPRGAIG